MAERTRPSLRPARFDDLGLRRALGDRLLPLLVAAMAFLAALALAGSAGAAALVQHWQEGAEAALTVQVPSAGDPPPSGPGTRGEAVLAALQATPGIAAVHRLSDAELAALLRPWLGADGSGGGGGGDAALPLPAVIAAQLAHGVAQAGPDLPALQARLAALAPGTLVESHGVWVQRLALLARSLQACAWLVL
ncbi:MAG TPA: ABC transporter permease, partial [Acetobacteraceae bacterium]|nr:ABC transporter permease [Acetobacteraceae bacterium]